MASKLGLIVLFILFTAALSQKCREFCRTTFEESEQDCRRDAFAIENCESRPCLIREPDRTFRGGWSCTKPTGEPICPTRCFRLRQSAELRCRRLSPRCQVSRCRTEELGKQEGYRCGDAPTTTPDVIPSQTPSSTPEPSPTSPTETPSGSPSASSRSSPDPSPSQNNAAMEFTMNTFMTGSMSGDMADVPSTLEGNPRTFSMSYNLTINDGGLVSISGVADSVNSIECFMNGTIRIRMGSDMSSASAQEMYPLGAVLVIDRDIFGDCIIEEPPSLADNEEDEEVRSQTDRGAQFRDAYLRIESVSGSSEDAFISGSATQLIGLFSEGEISVVANDPNLVRTDLPTSSKMDTFSLTLAQLNLGPLELTTEGSIIDNGGFRILTARWDRSGIDLQAQLAFELIAQLELKATLKVGVGGAPRSLFTIVSVPLYGIPDIPIIDDLVGNFSLPNIKLGIFFEIPLIVRVRAEIEKDLGSQAVARYTTGRKELTFFVTGPYTNIDAGVRLDRDDPAGPSFDFTPMLNGDDPVRINFIVFAGIRPQVILYLPFFEAGVGVEIGVETTGRFALPDMAFPPETMGGIGVCDTCHLVRVNANGRVQNAGAFGSINIAIPAPIIGSITIFRRRFMQNLPGNPTITNPIANGCFVREFGENTELCGTADCCNTEEMMCMTSGSGSQPMCTGSPSPTPSSSPMPTPTPGRPATCYTDPHLRTFDGLYYDCQASGEFTMVRSEATKLEVQARFSGSAARGTVTTGIAVASEGLPTVQVSMAFNSSTPSDDISSCPVLMYVDGVLRSINSGTGQNNLVTVSVNFGSIAIALNTGVSVSFSARDSSSFGCYFERLSVFLPETTIEAGPILGLLGTPNRNPMDDWMTSNGDPIPVPTTRQDLIFQVAYDYCTTNWCITDEANSFFTYEEGTLFSDFNRCDTPYGTPPDFSSASPALRDLCGEDSACLVDGLTGNIDDARVALTVQAEVDMESVLAQEFQFDPPIIVVETDINVVMTVDLSERQVEEARNVDKFDVFRVDSDTNEVISGLVVELFDNGLDLNSDEESGDLVFSNIIPIRSEMAGERFSFRAVPVIAGEPEDESPFVQTALNAVRSYSRASAIGGTGGDTLSFEIQSISGLELVARYSWPMDQRDLDTATSFSDEEVGFGCVSIDTPQYVSFSGDDTSAGGTETALIQIASAMDDGDWTDFTTVVFRAGWFGSVDMGPATLRLVLRDIASGAEIPNTGLSLAITPGVQNGCASTLVGTLEIRFEEEFGFRFLLISANTSIPTTVS